MARISGVDIPREKRLVISLTYIFGIGNTTAQKMCKELDQPRHPRSQSHRLRSQQDSYVHRTKPHG